MEFNILIPAVSTLPVELSSFQTFLVGCVSGIVIFLMWKYVIINYKCEEKVI